MGNSNLLLRVGLAAWRQERSGSWTAERLHRHQQQGLAALRRFAAEHSAFYGELHRGLEGQPLEALPIVTKAMLMADFDRVVTDPRLCLGDLEAHLAGAQADEPYLGRYTVLSTSGSTGLRGVFVFDEREWTQALAAIARPLAWAGAPPPWTRPRSAIIASAAGWHYSARIGSALASRWLPTLRLDAGAPLAELVEKLNAWQPQALAVYPSVLLQLAEEQLAGRLRIRLRHIGTSAERLPQATRRRVHAAWGIRVFDTYGATEYAPIATECREGHLHLLEDRAIVEVVDERGRAVPPGEAGARLLLTVLDRRTQPLIRYEISDGVRELPGRCACGRPFRMLAGIEGRVEETLAFAAAGARAGGPARVELHPNLFHELLERVPATGWQVRQEGDGRLAVLLTGTTHAEAGALLKAQLAALLAGRGASCPAIEVRWVEGLPRGASGKAPLILRTEARTEVRTEVRAEVRAEGQAEAGTEVRTDTRTDTPSDTPTDMRTDTPTDIRTDDQPRRAA
ncbi:MAG: phenylacetate--CoA ligase family protein [Burkholderiales bacterium]|nr:phenylacetate--CoA ligase family protein [Burkholderiales bacterium]